jgi:hypothetical protein
MSARFKSRANRLVAGLDRMASDIDPFLLAVALSLACADAGVFLATSLYGGPTAVMPPLPDTEDALPVATALDKVSWPE